MNGENQPLSDPEATAVPPSDGQSPHNSCEQTVEFRGGGGADTSIPAVGPQPAAPSKIEPPPAGRKGDLPKSIGRYQVRSRLGGGAFGVVYLGYDDHLDRQVAIKVPQLNARLDLLGEAKEVFLTEARQVAKLSHPGIAAVFEVGVEGDVCFIVSDYLDGPDLNRWLTKHTPSWQESVRIVASIADALAAAHARGIIHRDVKPANVIMTERAEGWMPVLVDFGLALSAETAASLAGQRGDHRNAGLHVPEQARRRTPH